MILLRTDPAAAPPSRWRRRRPRLFWAMAAGSLLLHALLLALILWLPPEKPKSGSEGPSFEMVMDGSPGTPNEKSNETARPAPGANTPAPGPETPPAPAPEPTPPPPAPTPPAPEPPAPPAPPAPITPPVPQPPAIPDAPPAPAPPPPNAVPRVTLQDPDQVPYQVPPPLTRPPIDITPLPPLTFAPPSAPRPQAARPQPRPPAPRSASGFPTPQNWSLNGGVLSQPAQQGAAGKTSMMAGPAVLGPSVPGPRITGADLGSDWIGLYTSWVRSHLYYPEQAALNGEDGTAEVMLQINRAGKVLSVELVTRSGSQWLDLSTTGMFRNARVPPFPANVTGDTATIDQTIHYILRRR